MGCRINLGSWFAGVSAGIRQNPCVAPLALNIGTPLVPSSSVVLLSWKLNVSGFLNPFYDRRSDLPLSL